MENSTGRVLGVAAPRLSQMISKYTWNDLLQDNELRVRLDHGLELCHVQLPTILFR